MRFNILFSLVIFCGCQYYGDKFPKNVTSTTDYSLQAKWGRGALGGTSDSYFRGLATDSSGNVYGVGRQYGNGTYTYGVGITATGSTTAENVIIVKYDNAGAAQWARTNTAGGGAAHFYSVATDSSGNIYAAGLQSGNGAYTYGVGVNVTGTASSNSLNNVLLVKYNSSGTALWARTNVSGDLSPLFYGVAIDSSGNIYAVGQQNPGTVDYGGGVTAVAGATGTNTLIVKYNSAGTALWARATVSGTSTGARFTAVAVDNSGNAYAVGNQSGTGSNTYGTGVSAAGSSSGGGNGNLLLVKYDSAGTAIWARSTTSGIDTSDLLGVTTDSAGDIYAVGTYNGTSNFNLGSGVSQSCPGSTQNGILIKYNSSGNALWARCAISGTNNGYFRGTTALTSGDIIVAGEQGGTGTTTYATNVSTTGANSGSNSVIIRYGADGTARYARSITVGPGASRFDSIASDSAGNVFTGGYQTGTGTYDYGDGITVAGSSSVTNAVMLKYSK
ncbi:MAG: hypothetical protein KF713_00055 [Turneriella sp.]|nr:hypothetical protein [Turneriella sp.]